MPLHTLPSPFLLFPPNLLSFLLHLLPFSSFFPYYCRLLECVQYIQRGLELWNDALKVPEVSLLLHCITIKLCKSSILFYAHYCLCHPISAVRVVLLFVLSSTARFCLHMGPYFYLFSHNNHKIHSSCPPMLPILIFVPYTSPLSSLLLLLTRITDY